MAHDTGGDTVFGLVDLPDFDRGVVTTIGGTLVDVTIPNEEGTRQAYAVKIDGLLETDPKFGEDGGWVPILFLHPEEPYQLWELPAIVIRRGDLTPNFERQSWFGYVKCPAADAQDIWVKVGDKALKGSSRYETRRWPLPMDISYEVQAFARLQLDAIKILHHLLTRILPPWFSVEVYDSKGDRRLYDAGPVSISSLSELADIADRTIGWSLSFDVRGEIDVLPPAFSGATPGVGEYGVILLPEVTFRPLPPPC